MNQIDQNYNDSKVKASEKLVGQINPDNFNFESNFSPIVKTEVKQEIAEEPLKDVEKNANIKNEIAKSQSKCTNSESSNEPIRLGPQTKLWIMVVLCWEVKWFCALSKREH